MRMRAISKFETKMAYEKSQLSLNTNHPWIELPCCVSRKDWSPFKIGGFKTLAQMPEAIAAVFALKHDPKTLQKP